MLKLAIPVLHVSSSHAAQAFYERLGFAQKFAYRPDPARADPCYQGLARDNVMLHLSSFSGDGTAGQTAFLIVDDVDSLHDEFVANGVSIGLSPTDQTWNNREMHVRDPDHNTLVFARPG